MRRLFVIVAVGWALLGASPRVCAERAPVDDYLDSEIKNQCGADREAAGEWELALGFYYAAAAEIQYVAIVSDEVPPEICAWRLQQTLAAIQRVSSRMKGAPAGAAGADEAALSEFREKIYITACLNRVKARQLAGDDQWIEARRLLRQSRNALTILSQWAPDEWTPARRNLLVAVTADDMGVAAALASADPKGGPEPPAPRDLPPAERAFAEAFRATREAVKLERQGNWGEALAAHSRAADLIRSVQAATPSFQPQICAWRLRTTQAEVERLRAAQGAEAAGRGNEPPAPSSLP